MTKLKGVCIGSGYFSQFHFEAWKRLEDVEITAVCDLNKEIAENAVKTYGFTNAYDDIEEMFIKEQPDFVDIITPPQTHLEICRLAMKHQVHIICQKPLAPSLDEAQQIADLIEQYNVRMMVHENFRFMPWYREIKKLLEQNVIGSQIHALNLRVRMGDGWQKDAYMNRQPYFREMKQLLMYETGVHFIDVFRYLGGKITKVYARLKRLNTNIKGEDFSWVQFDFANEGLGFIDANRYNESTAIDTRLTFGAVVLEGNKGTIRLYEDGKIAIQPLGEKEIIHNYTFKNRNFAGDCVFNTQEHFVEQLLSGSPFETDIATYIKNIEILEKVYESHEAGLPLDI
ncbi:Gfo/Idh/MocA family oxidoreductase [Aquimarina sp. ERC-38]|uniref:Gfo/Idh/MocA family protein n=1 Tax=Aquimarina sp. ERC-38 TaxID=2949996 RepID=UPI00224513C1|nr:Gfo/Idh/MocA family oxidoreductase [Aquimarina sp. ERC-38]UZO79779.1 Gfo/Idh/MocA family oxidoreductase [Aquimarina sp. ERC-38]